jgi:hypothetical protein
VGGGLYLFCYDCLEAGSAHNWPEPPETLLEVLEAQDPASALEAMLYPGVEGIFPYDPDVIVNERRLEPRSLIEGEDPYDPVLDDLSESSESGEVGF